MKFFSKIVLIAVIFSLSTIPARANHEGHPHDAEMQERVDASKPAAEAGEVIHVKANGLVCDFCARAMEKVFMKRPEVLGLSIDLTTKRIDIRLKKGQTLDDKTVRDLVTTSGYSIESIERQPEGK